MTNGKLSKLIQSIISDAFPKSPGYLILFNSSDSQWSYSLYKIIDGISVVSG